LINRLYFSEKGSEVLFIESFKIDKMNKSFLFYIIAYWHDPRFKRKVGGLIKIFDLANNLTRLGHNVILFSPKIGFPERQTIAKVIEIPFIDLPILRPLTFHLLASLVLFLKIYKRPSCIYVRRMNSFLQLLLAKLFKIPSVFEIPDDPYLAYTQQGMIRRLLEKLIDKYSMMLANKIVVPSGWSKRRLNRIGGIPLSKLIVLPSGSDTELFTPLSREECCTGLGFDPSLLYVGFAGSFFSYQGIDTLIDSAPKILKQFVNTRFLLIGDGPMMYTWQDKVSQKGLQEAFIFSGLVPYKQVPQYIGAMDICVAPHKRDTNQSSPVKLFDYMACGKPIVASDIDVVREIINHNECAILVHPDNSTELANAIIFLLGDKIKREEMGAAARDFVISKYDRKQTAKTVQAIAYRLSRFYQN